APVCGRPSLEVGRSEGGLPVPAVGGPEDREQGLILRDRENLAVTEGPSLGGEIKRKDPDFADVCFGHGNLRSENGRLTPVPGTTRSGRRPTGTRNTSSRPSRSWDRANVPCGRCFGVRA